MGKRSNKVGRSKGYTEEVYIPLKMVMHTEEHNDGKHTEIYTDNGVQMGKFVGKQWENIKAIYEQLGQEKAGKVTIEIPRSLQKEDVATVIVKGSQRSVKRAVQLILKWEKECAAGCNYFYWIGTYKKYNQFRYNDHTAVFTESTYFNQSYDSHPATNTRSSNASTKASSVVTVDTLKMTPPLPKYNYAASSTAPSTAQAFPRLPTTSDAASTSDISQLSEQSSRPESRRPAQARSSASSSVSKPGSFSHALQKNNRSFQKASSHNPLRLGDEVMIYKHVADRAFQNGKVGIIRKLFKTITGKDGYNVELQRGFIEEGLLRENLAKTSRSVPDLRREGRNAYWYTKREFEAYYPTRQQADDAWSNAWRYNLQVAVKNSRT